MVSLPFENESGNLQLLAAGGADGIADCASVQVFYQNFTFFCDGLKIKLVAYVKRNTKTKELVAV